MAKTVRLSDAERTSLRELNKIPCDQFKIPVARHIRFLRLGLIEDTLGGPPRLTAAGQLLARSVAKEPE